MIWRSARVDLETSPSAAPFWRYRDLNDKILIVLINLSRQRWTRCSSLLKLLHILSHKQEAASVRRNWFTSVKMMFYFRRETSALAHDTMSPDARERRKTFSISLFPEAKHFWRTHVIIYLRLLWHISDARENKRANKFYRRPTRNRLNCNLGLLAILKRWFGER